jgi:hypothetical protein
MTTWLVYFCVALAVFLLLARIPGMDHIFRMVFGLFGKLLEAVTAHTFLWIGYIIRTLFRAHLDVGRHLFTKEEDYDIELFIKNKERGKP